MAAKMGGPGFGHKRTSGRRWLRRAVILLIPVLLLTCVMHLVRQPISANNGQHETYVVQSGDTLWQVARAYIPEHMDIRAFIYQLERVNNLHGGIIHPGQQLVIPGR